MRYMDECSHPVVMVLLVTPIMQHQYMHVNELAFILLAAFKIMCLESTVPHHWFERSLEVNMQPLDQRCNKQHSVPHTANS